MLGESRQQQQSAGAKPVSGPASVSPPRRWLDRTGDEIAAWFGNAAAASRRQRDAAAGDHAGQGPKDFADSDTRIINEVGQRLTAEPMINASNIEVLCVAGSVTLNGSVATSAEKTHAEHLTMSVSGVKQVSNHLQVV